ncbi:hypothetical protein [Nocardia higoensis]|uniref:hypothetical protein n=1 Tax=Nocardia higoensis TaxID=228599 RepID=UPI0002EB2AF4|nr:hypothetical protein [Nocardia higoensis]
MVLPHSLATFNRRVTNRVAGPLASKVRPLAVVVHKGRHSGRAYETPVLAFADGPVHRIALTYGRDVDWLKNILAAGEFELKLKNHAVRLTDPVVIDDPSVAWAPVGVRQALKTIGARSYLRAAAVEHPAEA